MIDARAKDAFWTVVEQCLVQIHRLGLSDAQQKCRELRDQIESPPTGMSGDMFYHSEPFDVACDLADKSLDLSEYRSGYEAILATYNW